MWGGLALTFMLTFFGIIFAFPLGVLLALGRRSELPVFRYFCIAFIEFWRGIPLITVIFAAAIMFPLFIPANANVDKLLRVAIGISIFESAYIAEVVRGGLQSLPKGQYEAAKSLGMGYWKMNFLIILPQAIKTVIPGITNTFIALFKDTPLIILVGLLEILGMVNLAKSNSYWSVIVTGKQASFSYEENVLKGVNIYGVTSEYKAVQSFNIGFGRYFSEADFLRGGPLGVIGYKVAEELFGKAEKALGKTISYGGRRVMVIGVIEKQGSAIINGFDYDKSVLTTYNYFASIYNPDNSNPYIMVQAKPGVPSALLQQELTGVMRQIRKLSPTQEDNFTCNDVAQFKDQIDSVFGSINSGGWAIAGLSLIVGAFGVANIMFVTVRERTSQIGLKKAIGAKSSTILYEFLLESAFLCIIGGLVGLFLVWIS